MAFVEARRKRHEFISVEHLLLVLLDNQSAQEALIASAVDIDKLRMSLADYIKESTPLVDGVDEVDSKPTLDFQRVIQRAIKDVQSASKGKKEVFGVNVLVSLFGETSSIAVYQLHGHGATRLDVVNFIARAINKKVPEEPPKEEPGLVHYVWSAEEVRDLIANAQPDLKATLELFFERGRQNAQS